MLIDGNSLTYRAFFALPTDLATASGQVTNAVFGFTSMLINLVRDHKPDRDRGRLRPARADVPPRAGRRPTRPTATRRPTSSASRWAWSARSLETLRHPDPRGGGLRGRRHHRHARHPGPRRRATTSSSSPATATATSSSRTRTSRSSTTSGACRTTPSTTRPASRSAPASPRRCTCSTPRCAATRPTTCPACPGVGEKTAAKLINTYGGLDGIFDHVDEQTPKLPREPRPSTRRRSARTLEVMVLRARRAARRSTVDDLATGAVDVDEVRRLFDFLEFRTLFDRLAEALDADLGPAPGRPRCSRRRSPR